MIGFFLQAILEEVKQRNLVEDLPELEDKRVIDKGE